MSPRIIIHPQITLTDLVRGTEHLDVSGFTRRVLPRVAHPFADGLHAALVDSLYGVPLAPGGDLGQLFREYLDGEVDRAWLKVLGALRIAGTRRLSVYAPPDGSLPTFYRLGQDGVVREDEPLRPHDVVLRPPGRSLGLVMERRALPAWREERLPLPSVPPRADALARLVDVLVERTQATVGGPQYLEADPSGRALEVLAVTVREALTHPWASRLLGDRRVVAPAAYAAVFKSLGLTEHFETARAVLERRPEDGVAWRRRAVLRFEDGYVDVIRRPRESASGGGIRFR